MSNSTLVVFDLDYTLWPFFIDNYYNSSFHIDQSGKVVDSMNGHVKLYEDTKEVLRSLHSQGFQLAVASRAEDFDGATELLSVYDLNQYFSYKEIYEGSKVNHFRRLQEDSGVPYTDMIFFDDDMWNISEVRRLGVYCVLVHDGITCKLVDEELQKFMKRN
ncbi:magnesium-dependent phosphatase 1 [Trichomycterus rosablanca]|uniref:magnesium-dependent phosphatase 1 n=1 Tax=Trichomycterus rosablanca TaxID=2290929 RepID=UPI002F358AA0